MGVATMRGLSSGLDWTCGDAALDEIVHEQMMLIADAIGVDPARISVAIADRSSETSWFAKRYASRNAG